MYKSQIKEQVLLNQKIGNSFAFMLDKGDYEQLLIVVNFLFFEFKPILKCNYSVEIQLAKNGSISLLEKREISTLDDLINYLANKGIDPAYCKAMH